MKELGLDTMSEHERFTGEGLRPPEGPGMREAYSNADLDLDEHWLSPALEERMQHIRTPRNALTGVRARQH
jgi:hypothetical protein